MWLFRSKVFASSRSECLRIARQKPGFSLGKKRPQPGMDRRPDAMDRSATPSRAHGSGSSNFTGARFGSASRQSHVASTSKTFCSNAFCCDWLIRDCKLTLSPSHRGGVTTCRLEPGARWWQPRPSVSAFRAQRYSIPNGHRLSRPRSTTAGSSRRTMAAACQAFRQMVNSWGDCSVGPGTESSPRRNGQPQHCPRGSKSLAVTVPPAWCRSTLPNPFSADRIPLSPDP